MKRVKNKSEGKDNLKVYFENLHCNEGEKERENRKEIYPPSARNDW